MLVLQMQPDGEDVIIGDPESPIVRIRVVSVNGAKVRVGFDTTGLRATKVSGDPRRPDRVEIFRKGLAERVAAERRQARAAGRPYPPVIIKSEE